MYGCNFQKTVVKTKSVEYLPFLLSFFFFLNGGVWLLYAVLVRDSILGVSYLHPMLLFFLFFLTFMLSLSW